MKDLIVSVAGIFSAIGRAISFIRNFFINTALLIVLGVVLFSLFADSELVIQEKSILSLDLQGELVEQARPSDALEKFLESDQDLPASQTVLQDALDAIEKAASDPSISILHLNLKDLQGSGLNQLQTLGAALNVFKQSGKPVIAAQDYYTQAQYFLASYADEVIINPMGGVEIHGFGTYRLYFKEALDKLAINYHIFRVGDYKSAVEPFLRDDMSPQDRRQNMLWLSALWNIYLKQVATNRKTDVDRLRSYPEEVVKHLQGAGGDPAKMAVDFGLADKMLSRNELRRYLAEKAQVTEKKLNVVTLSQYLNTVTPSYNGNDKEQQIGLIVAEGNIVPGKQPPGIIGADSMVATLREAREDSSIKAVVVRINSGGGSAFAAEVIRREIVELKKAGKPVVVSMGSVAASGGYWLAADADKILASDTTLTGSIGIFGAIPTFEESLARLGVHGDGVGTTPLTAGLNLAQPLSPEIREAIQLTIEHHYRQFLEIVATGRKLTVHQVASLAQGKVYDGNTAQRLGLVDAIGDLDEAIAVAAKMAKVDDYGVWQLQAPEGFREQLLSFFTSLLAFSAEKFGIDLQGWLRMVQSTPGSHLFTHPDPRNIYAHSLLNISW